MMERIMRIAGAGGHWQAMIVALVLLSSGAARADESQGFQYPLAVAAAADGTLYIADRLLPGVWKVTDGQPSVFARGEKRFRTPLNAIRGVAVAADGSVFVGDSATREVYRLDADGAATPLTDGAIGIPVDIAIDREGTMLYVSDLETQRIWKLPAAGGQPEELVQLAAPRGLFVDGDDRLWAVAASGEAPLVRVAADGSVEPVVASRAFEFPHDVVVDDEGTAFVSDNYARCLWKVTADGEITKLASGEPLVGPVGLTKGPAGVLVADPRAKAIFSISADGSIVQVAPAATEASP
jgi:DNA-binding beta-propeller fold protein YncE